MLLRGLSLSVKLCSINFGKIYFFLLCRYAEPGKNCMKSRG